MQGTICGGKSQTKTWDDKAQQLLDKHKDEIMQKLSKTSDNIQPQHYTTQVVNGTNYFLTVKVDGQDTEIRIHEALPCYGGESTLGEVKEL